MKSLYKILDVAETASTAEIKKAYKSKAGKLHPDKNEGANKEKFQELQNAYSILKDKNKRKRYDETGSVEELKVSEEALKLISSLYLQIAEANMFQSHNYIANVETALRNSLRQCSQDLKTIEIKCNSLKYLIENTKAGEGFLSILNGKLRELTLSKSQAEDGKEVMEKSLKILTEYEYTGEIPETKTGSGMPWKTGSGMPEPYIT